MGILLLLVALLFCFLTRGGLCKSGIPIGYQLALSVPTDYNNTFSATAFLLQTPYVYTLLPNFKVALTLQALNGGLSCSLGVFLGDFRVWNSGHSSHFYPIDICLLQLTNSGDLQLKDSKGRIGWHTATSAQGVQTLQLLREGNLVLRDGIGKIKWQSFNFPTNVMLWGQRLSVWTRLTSFFHNNASTIFSSLEIENNSLQLYLNSRVGVNVARYSYWKYEASRNQSIAFAELASTGLKLMDRNVTKLAQIFPTTRHEQPIRFLKLEETTGNIKFYYYNTYKAKFESSFETINVTCDLPLTCGAYSVCTVSNSCSCIQVSSTKAQHMEGFFNQELCSKPSPVEMVEVVGVDCVLRIPPKRVNVSRDDCLNLCTHDCKCAAALYKYSSSVKCFHYEYAGGLKQVGDEGGTGFNYFVKIPKGLSTSPSNLKPWLLILVSVADGLVILSVVGGFGYYFFVTRMTRS